MKNPTWLSFSETAINFADSAMALCKDDEENDLNVNYDLTDLAPEAVKAIIEDCERFERENEALLEKAFAMGYKESSVGYDLFLTRNGHGFGFWDRDLADIGDELTTACEKMGEFDLYIGDDGKLYN